MRFSAVAVTALMTSALAASGSAGGPIRFEDVATSAGLEFRGTSGGTPSQEILEVTGGGVALIDYDDDGDLDLFLANGATMREPEKGPGSRLFANDGRGRFRDVTEKLGIRLRRWAMGVAVGDYDGDGDDDLYVTCYGPNVLLRNDGRGANRRFTDVSTAAGVADPGWGSSAAFGDVDGDGDLDLYVANYLQFDIASPPDREGNLFKGVPVFRGPAGLPAQHDRLFLNLGAGKFEDVAAASGARPERPGYGLAVVMLDFDSDGLQDIFVGNDSTENFFFHNRGDGKFEEIGYASGWACNFDGRTQATMGIAIADVDGNGRPDFFTSHFSSDTNTLHLGVGDRLLADRTSQFGLAAISRPFLSWGAGFFDFDSDGSEDLFVANGHIYPEADAKAMDSDYAQHVLLMRRTGKRFSRVDDAGAWLGRKYGGRSVAFGDLDDDGDVDVAMTTLNDAVVLLRNESVRRDVAVVELDAGRGNPRGLGSRVELTIAGRTHRRWIHGGSYQSVNAAAAYFGLGDAEGEASLEVQWPDGSEQRFAGIPLNRRVAVERGRRKLEVKHLSGRSAEVTTPPTGRTTP